MLDRSRITALAEAWRTLDREPDLVLPAIDEAITKLNRLNIRADAFLASSENRTRDIARRLADNDLALIDAIAAQVVSADDAATRKAVRDLSRSAADVVVHDAQAHLLANGGRIHDTLRTEYAAIMERTRELAPLVAGIANGAQALDAAPDARSAWMELRDMSKRRDAIRQAHNACRGAGIWGAMPRHPFPSWAFEYPHPDEGRPQGFAGLPDELKLVADATARHAALYRNAEAIAHADRYEQGRPPEPSLVVGEVDLVLADKMKRKLERNHVPG